MIQHKCPLDGAPAPHYVCCRDNDDGVMIFMCIPGAIYSVLGPAPNDLKMSRNPFRRKTFKRQPHHITIFQHPTIYCKIWTTQSTTLKAPINHRTTLEHLHDTCTTHPLTVYILPTNCLNCLFELYFTNKLIILSSQYHHLPTGSQTYAFLSTPISPT